MKQKNRFKKHVLGLGLIALLLCSWVHAEWTDEKIRQFAMKELVVPNARDFVLYRWGDRAHELARLESKLGKGVPPFDLDTVNRGNQAGGKGLYLLDSVSDASIYVASQSVGAEFNPALVEVVVQAGAAYIDLVNRKVLAKVHAAGLMPQDILDANPQALVRFATLDGRNPGFHRRLIWVAKNPLDVVVREYTGAGQSVFDLMETESRILDVSRNPAALSFYRSRVKRHYRDFAYVRNPVTGRVLLYRTRDQFFSIALNPAEPVPGVRLDGSCGLFLPVAKDYLVSVVDSIGPEFCRDSIPTEVSRDLKGQCAEVLQADPRVVLQYLDESRCQPLFCRSKRVFNPTTGFSKGGYSISVKGREHLNLPVDPAHGFNSLNDCRDSMRTSIESGIDLVCLPSDDDLFKVASIHSVTAPLPEYGASSLGECLSWIEAARKDLQVLCEKRGPFYEIVSYKDPFQHRKLSQPSFASLEACTAAASSLTESAHVDLDREDSERGRILRDVGLRHPEDLLKLIKREYPYLNALLQSSAQVWEMETIEDHVRKVIAIAQEIAPMYHLDQMPKEDPRLVHIKSLMNVLLIMHDMGKGLGRKIDQYDLHFPVVTHFLRKWGYSEFEVQLATELLMIDVIGQMIQEKASIKDSFASLRRKATRLGIPLNTFLRLHMIYYSADAGAYESLRSLVFTRQAGAPFFPLFFLDHAVELLSELNR